MICEAEQITPFTSPGKLTNIVMSSPVSYRQLLGIADLPNRVLALPLFNLGVLWVGGAGSRLILRRPVAMRLWVMAALKMLVVVRLAPAVVLVIGVIDLAVSVMTAMCWAAVTRE